MDQQRKLTDIKTFNTIIKNTPLISIDLLVMNEQEEVLLGWRNNQPARDCWFVPGGRILKDESIHEAFHRICMTELGISMQYDRSFFSGVYEHFHPNQNFSGEPGYGTHYIVFACKIKLSKSEILRPDIQHAAFKWMPVKDLLADPQVHPLSKDYFNGKPSSV